MPRYQIINITPKDGNRVSQIVNVQANSHADALLDARAMTSFQELFPADAKYLVQAVNVGGFPYNDCQILALVPPVSPGWTATEVSA